MALMHTSDYAWAPDGVLYLSQSPFISTHWLHQGHGYARMFVALYMPAMCMSRMQDAEPSL